MPLSEICTISDCNGSSYIGGLCPSHYWKSKPKKKCTECGEIKPYYANGMCRTCYIRVDYHKRKIWPKKKCIVCSEKRHHPTVNKDGICCNCITKMNRGLNRDICKECNKTRWLDSSGVCKECKWRKKQIEDIINVPWFRECKDCHRKVRVKRTGWSQGQVFRKGMCNTCYQAQWQREHYVPKLKNLISIKLGSGLVG